LTEEKKKANHEKIPEAMGHIVCNEERCAGCRTCEAVCSLSHEGVVSPVLARLEIISYPLEGWRIKSVTCKQCRGPDCLYVCPTKALYVDNVTGARVIDAGKCIGCKLCMEACPQYPNTPIRHDSKINVCFKCDLCGGEPLCVKFCPEAALSFLREEI
jgi:carbon-monoxide dehydrogenase iron sulfur subunit